MAIQAVKDIGTLVLNWAVAKSQGLTIVADPMGFGFKTPAGGFWVWQDPALKKLDYRQIGKDYSPVTDWSDGGPILDALIAEMGETAFFGSLQAEFSGMAKPSLLVAAMRIYVTRKLGSRIDVPDELLED